MKRATVVIAIASTIACVASCDSRKPAPEPPPPMPPSVKAMAPDTMMRRVDSTMRHLDSMGKRKSRSRDSAQLRDSAFGPKFEVDSMGKVRPARPVKPADR